MDDKKIIALLWQRSERALEALANKFGTRLLSLARNILGDPRDAEESVSDTYLAVWNAVPPKKPDPFPGFVYHTGRNQALKRLRYETAKQRDTRYDISLEELSHSLSGATLEDEFDARLLGRAIDRFLDTLSRENRVLFLRRYWFGDSIRELAVHFAMTENTVKVRLSRIREKLRTYLAKEGFIHEGKTDTCTG